MKLIKNIMNYFKEDEENTPIKIPLRSSINDKYPKEIIKGMKENKSAILLIDDSEGVVSFLRDDLEYLDKKNIIDIEEINILELSGNNAAFVLERVLELKDCRIKYAIIDITLGSSSVNKNGKKIRYTGVDVYKMLYEIDPSVVFFFYTGNSLNPYIKSNKKLIEQFTSISGDDINNYVLFKNSLSMNNRIIYIADKLFNRQIKQINE